MASSCCASWLPRPDGGSESFGETALRLRWKAARLPRPRTQVPIEREGRDPYRLDLGLEEERFGGEYDGEEFHGPEQEKSDGERRDVISDRGWGIEVFRKAGVFGREQDAEPRLRAAWADVQARKRHRSWIL